MKPKFVPSLVIAGLLASTPVSAAPAVPVTRSVEGFSDLADLTLGAPIILRAMVAKADRLGPKDAPDLPPGRVRLLVQATVQAAILAPSAVAPTIRYLWELPADARGKPPKLKGATILLFARPVPGREDQIVPTGPNSQISATPTAEANVRRIIAENRDPMVRDLRITGVTSAFHVAGSIAGEAETQIFLGTANQRPVSLVVLSRPGQSQSFSFASGDVIDDAATPISVNSMLWYRLACALPATLPAGAAREMVEGDRVAAAADYRFVIQSLGPCGRSLRTN